MKTAVLLLVLLLLVASCLIVSLPVNGEARTIVVPDDYATIGEAISNAAEGDSVFVKKGTYQEQTLTISKTLSLKGENADSTVIVFHPPLFFVGWHSVIPQYTYDKSLTIQASDVEISGFTISAELTSEAPADLANYTLGPCDPPFIAAGGAQILSTGNNTKITGNTIRTGLTIEGSNQTIAENTLASGLGCYGSSNKVFSNLVTGSGINVGGCSNEIHANNIVGAYKIQAGIQVDGDANVIAGNNVTNCNSGLVVYHGYSYLGSNNLAYGNRLTKNVHGIVIAGGNNNTLFANELLNNSVGIKIEPTSFHTDESEMNATFHHNNLIGSIQQVSVEASAAVFFDAHREGNYWSDYTGEDADGNGIGDTPYFIDNEHKDTYPLMAPFDISSASLSSAFPDTSSEHESEPFPTVSVTAASIAVIIVVAGLLVCFRRKFNRQVEST